MVIVAPKSIQSLMTSKSINKGLDGSTSAYLLLFYLRKIISKHLHSILDYKQNTYQVVSNENENIQCFMTIKISNYLVNGELICVLVRLTIFHSSFAQFHEPNRFRKEQWVCQLFMKVRCQMLCK